MTKTSLFIIFFLLLIGIGGVGYQQLQITRLSERLNQEENCNFALTMVSLARITKDSDSSQSNDIWISQGQKLSKRSVRGRLWNHQRLKKSTQRRNIGKEKCPMSYLKNI